jgi:diguanylate cyclase (GGDEF)-like protein
MLNQETLLLVQVSFTLLTTVLLVSAALYSDSPAEQRLWAVGNVASCLGLALGALTALPLWVHAVLSYGAMSLGLAWVLKGLRLFYQRDLPWAWVAAIALAGMALPAYYAFVDPSLSARLVVTGFYLGLLNGACAYTLLRHGGGRAMLPCVTGFAALGLVLVLRGAYLLATPHGNGAMTDSMMAASLFAIPLTQVCILFGLILMVARRYAERLQQLSMLDPLTGVLNRGAFQTQGQRIVQRAGQAGQAGQAGRPVTVVMVDADHFKLINDTHGHPTGDEVLRRLSRLLTAQLRPADLLARYGDEEFVLVLDDLDRDAAAKVAERLRQLVEQQALTIGSRALNYTISLGLACSDQHGHALDTLVAASDAALYAAKKAGRNRVSTA